MSLTLRIVLLVALLAAIFYLGFALTRYRFQHPELTETQLFQRIPEALGFD